MTTFEKIKRAALARLDAGEDLEHILQDYADFEEELRPVLEEAAGVSLADLLHRPAGKAKIKPKHEPVSPARSLTTLLVVGGLAVFGGLGFLLFSARTSTPPMINVVPVTNPAEADPCLALNVAPQVIQYGGYDPNQGNDYAVTGSMPAAPSGVAAGESDDTGAGTSEMALAAMPTASPLATSVMAEEGEARAGADTAPDASIVMGGVVAQQQPQEPMRAGEIDDNADWDTYQDYRRTWQQTYGTWQIRDVDITDRRIIQVVDREGLPIMGACVQVFNGPALVTQSRTYATGLTMFFPNLNESTRYVDQFRVRVTHQGSYTENTLNRDLVMDTLTFRMDLVQTVQQRLDVLFLLDATGSMGDEIAQLQNNILTIADQINTLQGNVDVRYGLVSYRDFGDEYVTRMDDFTADVNSFRADLSSVRANGGGDYPEAMNEALDVALNAMNWRGGDTVKLVFLVADAPPQIGITPADYSLLMQNALARGIKIHPIASSGLQPEGEYIMRQIGQFTMGRFLFLTYEEGVPGTPGDDRPDLAVGDPKDAQGVGDYSVSQLDELVMRLIRDELAALQGQ